MVEPSQMEENTVLVPSTQDSPEKRGDSPILENHHLHFQIRARTQDAPASVQDPCRNILDELERVDSNERYLD